MRFKLRHRRRRRKKENSVVDLESQELWVRKALTLGSWKSVWDRQSKRSNWSTDYICTREGAERDSQLADSRGTGRFHTLPWSSWKVGFRKLGWVLLSYLISQVEAGRARQNPAKGVFQNTLPGRDGSDGISFKKNPIKRKSKQRYIFFSFTGMPSLGRFQYSRLRRGMFAPLHGMLLSFLC